MMEKLLKGRKIASLIRIHRRRKVVESIVTDTNASESVTIHLRCLRMPLNRLRFSHDAKNALRVCYELSTIFLTSQNFCHEFPIAQELQQRTTIQLRTSRTDYDSSTNPKIYQFQAIRGIRGLCGIGALKGHIRWHK